MRVDTPVEIPIPKSHTLAGQPSLFDRGNRKAGLQKALDNARDADAVREMFRREDQEEPDEDLGDWSDEDSDRPGIGAVATPGWGVRSVGDFMPWQKRH